MYRDNLKTRILDVLLTVHLSIILATDQLMYKFLFYIPLPVSSTVVLISRRSNCIIQHLVSSHSVGGRPVRTGWPPTGVMIPDAV